MNRSPGPSPLFRFGWGLPLVLGVALGLQTMETMREARAAWAVGEPVRTVRLPTAGGGTQLQPATLSGPGGNRFRIPPGEPTIVHVWLQGCADCMPKFNALKALQDQGEQLPLPVVNVAYGRADPAWAARYGVDQGLVIDPGQHLVRPLGIGTLTTLVVTADGRVVSRENPTQPGYLDRLNAAVAGLGGAAAPAPAPTPAPPAAPAPTALTVAISLLGSLTLLVLGASWGILALVVGKADEEWAQPAEAEPKSEAKPAGATAGEAEPDAIQPGIHAPAWQEALIAAGRPCPYCQEPFRAGDGIRRCERCQASFHRTCGEEVGGCTTLGCTPE